jgi:hypothetical protein
VPWISFEHNGHAALGGIDERKRILALARRLCQICGERLDARMYLLVRPRDVRAGYTTEPALHPECHGYSTRACPMLSGDMTHHHRSPLLATHPAGRPCGDPACPCKRKPRPPADQSARAGAPAEDWDGWMIDPPNYRLRHHPSSGALLGLDLDDITPLKIRPVRRVPRPDVEEAVASLRLVLDLLTPKGDT